MTLGNMRELGVQRLIASCLNDACWHTALIDVSSYPRTPRSRHSAVARSAENAAASALALRSNWKEQPPQESLTGKQWR